MREAFAEALGERLRGQLGIVVLAAQLLDGDVARGVDLGARDDPGRAVLVPDPHVLHLHVEERIARLRRDLEVELVAEVGRVGREDAVAEEAEDGRVLPLQRQLELRLEFVQIVQVGHSTQSSSASSSSTPPWPGTTSFGARSARGSRTNRRSCRRGCGTVRPVLVDHLVAVEQQVEVDRARPPALPALAPQPTLDGEEDVEQLPRRELGLERGDAVQKPRLVGDADRIRLAQGRDGDDARELCDRRTDRLLAVAQIGAEADVRDRHGRVARTAANVTGGSSTTSGLRTRTETPSTGKRATSSSATADASASSRW